MNEIAGDMLREQSPKQLYLVGGKGFGCWLKQLGFVAAMSMGHASRLPT